MIPHFVVVGCSFRSLLLYPVSGTYRAYDLGVCCAWHWHDDDCTSWRCRQAAVAAALPIVVGFAAAADGCAYASMTQAAAAAVQMLLRVVVVVAVVVVLVVVVVWVCWVVCLCSGRDYSSSV